MIPDLGDNFEDKMNVVENARILAVSLLGTELSRTFEISLCDVYPVGKCINTESPSSESISWESCSHCELVNVTQIAILDRSKVVASLLCKSASWQQV
ncbi:hypothetical protein AVEN_51821-1 [Araneus ventricosus]|uniref:Uncharacterized protein n=1 Tax=Araneus ventricosus TaxID=182803 RepID=A0A4Y2H4X7_ARAVE|nr:hypothetical protein AVEN_51821-1 [Araneus ventricosus]